MNRLEGVKSYCLEQAPAMTALLKEFVEMETPGEDKEALDRFGQKLAKHLAESGFGVEILPQQDWGNHLLATWGSGPVRVLTLCHMDTVWPVGTVQERPFSVENDVATGPGANDMKSGIVALVYAVRALETLGINPGVRVSALFNSDEEQGSLSSRAIIEQQARKSDVCFVIEPGTAGSGGIKTWRKGVGIFQVEIKGKASHAGVDPDAGVHAIAEMAHQIQIIHALGDRAQGTTVSVGVVEGGSKSNVIPDYAKATVDTRAMTMQEAERLVTTFHGLKPANPQARIEVSGGMNRPPMEKSDTTDRLYRLAADISAALGLKVAEEGSGGGTDGNFVAAVGTPVLDGLGPLGGKSHSPEEFCLLETIPLRSALLAMLLIRVGEVI
jgi:glutamate carboxypeptidase